MEVGRVAISLDDGAVEVVGLGREISYADCRCSSSRKASLQSYSPVATISCPRPCPLTKLSESPPGHPL